MESSVTKNKDTTEKQRKTRQPTNRIVVSEAAKTKIEVWGRQIETEIPGFHIAKVDLVNWMICNRSEQLTTQEVMTIRDEFFDRGRCIRLALKELAEAQKHGDGAKTGELIKRYAFLFESESPKRPRKTSSKSQKNAESENDTNIEKSLKNSGFGDTKEIVKHKE